MLVPQRYLAKRCKESLVVWHIKGQHPGGHESPSLRIIAALDVVSAVSGSTSGKMPHVKG